MLILRFAERTPKRAVHCDGAGIKIGAVFCFRLAKFERRACFVLVTKRDALMAELEQQVRNAIAPIRMLFLQ